MPVVTAVVEPRRSTSSRAGRAAPGVDAFASLRAREYGRLDRAGDVYLDHGRQPYAESRPRAPRPSAPGPGQPHSENPTSRARPQLADRPGGGPAPSAPRPTSTPSSHRERQRSNAVGEAFPFTTERSRPDGRQTTRSFASASSPARGAALAYVPLGRATFATTRRLSSAPSTPRPERDTCSHSPPNRTIPASATCSSGSRRPSSVALTSSSTPPRSSR